MPLKVQDSLEALNDGVLLFFTLSSALAVFLLCVCKGRESDVGRRVVPSIISMSEWRR